MLSPACARPARFFRTGSQFFHRPSAASAGAPFVTCPPRNTASGRAQARAGLGQRELEAVTSFTPRPIRRPSPAGGPRSVTCSSGFMGIPQETRAWQEEAKANSVAGQTAHRQSKPGANVKVCGSIDPILGQRDRGGLPGVARGAEPRCLNRANLARER